MSVLVEALSLIVPRKVLDVSFPGGTDAFMHHMRDPSVPCRLVCADDRLVSVSFHRSDQVRAVGDELADLGIMVQDDDRFQELAVVDQLQGPTLPCDWLEWRQHDDGFTYCWLAGTDPGEMSAPPDWTPEQSRKLVFADFRDIPGRCLRLAVKDGLETWLDFETGIITGGLVPRPAHSPNANSTGDPPAVADDSDSDGFDASASPAGSLMATVRAVLEGRRYRYVVVDAEALTLTIHGKKAIYAMLMTANDATGLVRMSGSYGANIPADRRIAIAEALSRINSNLCLGNFELDFEDGELRYRISVDVEGGTLSEKMVDNMLGCLLQTMERYQHALMRVAYAGVEPAIAVEEVS